MKFKECIKEDVFNRLLPRVKIEKLKTDLIKTHGAKDYGKNGAVTFKVNGKDLVVKVIGYVE